MAAAVETPYTTKGQMGMWGGTKDGKPALVDYADKTGTNVNEPTQYQITVEDARYADPKPAFSRNGYEYVRHPTALTPAQLADYKSEEGNKIIEEVYAPECKKLVAQISGAVKVIPFHWQTRLQAHGIQDMVNHRASLGGLPIAHVDRDVISGLPLLKADVGAEEAEKLIRTHRRWGTVNVWRPIDEPVGKWPLCLVNHENIPEWSCDKNMAKIALKNAPDAFFKGKKPHDSMLIHHPEYRYHYLSNQHPDEAWVFAAFDSEESKAVPHGAFWDHSSPADAPPRHSFEIRCWAFYDPIEGAE